MQQSPPLPGTGDHSPEWTSVPAGMRPRLVAVDPSTLSDTQRLAAVEELERLKGAAAAAQARLTAAIATERGLPIHPVPSEPTDFRPYGSQVALARHESPSQGDEHVRLAVMLTVHLPRTMAALERGDISEWTAMLIAREAAHLDPARRHELDERIGPDLPGLSSRGARAAARRILADIDAEAVRRRMEQARMSRRVSMRPVGDGMAYLSILAPMTEVAGAHASLKAHALAVVAGSVDDESRSGRDGRERSLGAIMSDTALERLTGRAPTAAQPVTVNIVMTDRSLLGWGEQSRSDDEPALVPGLGPVPAGFARELLSDPEVDAFYRRLFTSPDGRDLVAMDSQARSFPAGLRTMIALRDQQCRTPFCDSPIAQTDHVHPHARGGPTTYRNGMGLCQRCNLVKEAPGFAAHVRPRDGTHVVDVRTPAGQEAVSVAPPLLGWGWRAPPDVEELDLSPDVAPNESVAERALRLAVAA
ncbi:DUF222 domain-containing protein [Nostocoides sp. F2B08]|uniref:HNH endonuclease n=1 Tax=Nostocoides sp. F2B08 TaxID=2653936 RepID=UPI0012636AC5|nr:HNH endonuclease signature motif containing protein [Tetrasphaera sp. F2B08]KAB7743281.1 DUF222 domain-containing protein [Tetrasphaera sp. F2B08]